MSSTCDWQMRTWPKLARVTKVMHFFYHEQSYISKVESFAIICLFYGFFARSFPSLFCAAFFVAFVSLHRKLFIISLPFCRPFGPFPNSLLLLFLKFFCAIFNFLVQGTILVHFCSCCPAIFSAFERFGSVIFIVFVPFSMHTRRTFSNICSKILSISGPYSIY